MNIDVEVTVDTGDPLEITIDPQDIAPLEVSVASSIDLIVEQPPIYEMQFEGGKVIELSLSQPPSFNLNFSTPPALGISVGTPVGDFCYVPPGGKTNQHLAKKTDADFDTHWVTPETGGGGGTGGDNEVTISNDEPTDGSEIWVDWDDPGTIPLYVTRIDFPTPSAQWTLDVGRPIGAIRVLNSAGDEVEPGNIKKQGTAEILTFSGAFSGVAWVTG